MVEQGGLPLVGVVARSAIALIAVLELVPVRVLMAFAAGLRSLAEVDMEERALHVWRLVAIGTIHGTMRPQKREFRVGVVESSHIVPIFCGVAGFAPDGFAGRVFLLHALGELTMVDVLVAGAAAELCEMVEHYRIGRSRLVTVVARHG